MRMSLANVARQSRRRDGLWQERDRRTGRQPPCTGRLSTPGLYLWRMFVFLVLVGLLIAVLHRQLWDAMHEQPGAQHPHLPRAAGRASSTPSSRCLRLYPEIRWVNAFRIADPGLAISHRPVLLCADGDDAARPHRLSVAVGHIDALDHGLDRLAAR